MGEGLTARRALRAVERRGRRRADGRAVLEEVLAEVRRRNPGSATDRHRSALRPGDATVGLPVVRLTLACEASASLVATSVVSMPYPKTSVATSARTLFEVCRAAVVDRADPAGRPALTADCYPRSPALASTTRTAPFAHAGQPVPPRVRFLTTADQAELQVLHRHTQRSWLLGRRSAGPLPGWLSFASHSAATTGYSLSREAPALGVIRPAAVRLRPHAGQPDPAALAATSASHSCAHDAQRHRAVTFALAASWSGPTPGRSLHPWNSAARSGYASASHCPSRGRRRVAAVTRRPHLAQPRPRTREATVAS